MAVPQTFQEWYRQQTLITPGMAGLDDAFEAGYQAAQAKHRDPDCCEEFATCARPCFTRGMVHERKKSKESAQPHDGRTFKAPASQEAPDAGHAAAADQFLAGKTMRGINYQGEIYVLESDCREQVNAALKINRA